MFDYEKAFSRNIGWVTKDEQRLIKSKKVAIAGAGGVGFEHAVTLARLGIERFTIADFDSFEVHNFNRQAGAFVSTIDEPKVSVLASVLKDINPHCQIEIFNEGVTESNLESFFDDVDIYVDSLDFFVIKIRRLIFNFCKRNSIPAITAAPLGMGSSVLCFTSSSMSFDDYFDMHDGEDEDQQLLKFLVGLSPKMLQREYLVVPDAANFTEQKGPSVAMAVKLCAGITGTNVVKLLLNRGNVIQAPKAQHFDAYKNKYVVTTLYWGNRGLLQKLKLKIASKLVYK